jgi:DNA repair protein RadC
LLAILLRIGNEVASAIDMGRDLIARLGGLQGIDRAHAEDIMQIKGLGLAKTAQAKPSSTMNKTGLSICLNLRIQVTGFHLISTPSSMFRSPRRLKYRED